MKNYPACRVKTHSFVFADPDGSGICNLSSPSYVEWDGLSVYLEAVMTRLNVTSDTSPEAVEGIALLKACLKYETQVQSIPQL